MSKEDTIKQACAYFNYKWPIHLYTGVMYFGGYKITVKEFKSWARNFK